MHCWTRVPFKNALRSNNDPLVYNSAPAGGSKPRTQKGIKRRGGGGARGRHCWLMAGKDAFIPLGLRDLEDILRPDSPNRPWNRNRGRIATQCPLIKKNENTRIQTKWGGEQTPPLSTRSRKKNRRKKKKKKKKKNRKLRAHRRKFPATSTRKEKARNPRLGPHF